MKRSAKFFLVVLALILSLGLALFAKGQNSIVSGYYGIDHDTGLIGQIQPGTDETILLSRILLAENASLSDGVKTGSVLTSGDSSLSLVVQADCNSDGSFSITDMLTVKSFLLQLQEFTAAQLAAGDVSGDGSVTITDFLQMKSNLLGLSGFTLRQIPGARCSSFMVLTPGETCSFAAADTADVVCTGDAVSWESGIITAHTTGTAMVTGGGESLVITVCDDPLTLSLPEEDLVIDPGATKAMETRLSHPVTALLHYSSSDPAVAAVDDQGNVTAVGEGVAAVTVSLPNGQTASQNVRVIPMVHAMSISQTSMKVKNNQSQKTLSVTAEPATHAEPLIWSSSDPAIATVDENGVVTGLSNGYVTISCTAQYSKVSASCEVKVCDLIQVALTFDDGPSTSYTPQVLDMLDKYGVTVTFFMVGNRISSASDIVKRMAESGHELGYHTWSHEYFFNMSASEIKADYELFCRTLEKACGQTPTVYRAPGGNINSRALTTIPLPHIMWSVDTRDWETRNTEKVKNAVLRGLKDGAIILVHDIHRTTYTGVLAAMEVIFAEDMDVEFLTVTELLSRNGTPPEAGQTYYKN